MDPAKLTGLGTRARPPGGHAAVRLAAALAAPVLFAVVGCSGGAVPGSGPTDATMTTVSSTPAGASEFTVTSSAFAENTPIPSEYSCHGRNVPPPLRWRNVPPGTQSLAVVVDDPDAPAGRYVHWVVTDIPPTTTEIIDGALPKAAVVSLNSGQQAEYLGPCPPAGTGVHHYRFQLYALRESPALTPTTPAPESTETIAELSVKTTRTVGLFGS